MSLFNRERKKNPTLTAYQVASIGHARRSEERPSVISTTVRCHHDLILVQLPIPECSPVVPSTPWV